VPRLPWVEVEVVLVGCGILLWLLLLLISSLVCRIHSSFVVLSSFGAIVDSCSYGRTRARISAFLLDLVLWTWSYFCTMTSIQELLYCHSLLLFPTWKSCSTLIVLMLVSVVSRVQTFLLYIKLSQNQPINRFPVFVQNITQPTPLDLFSGNGAWIDRGYQAEGGSEGSTRRNGVGMGHG